MTPLKPDRMVQFLQFLTAILIIVFAIRIIDLFVSP